MSSEKNKNLGNLLSDELLKSVSGGTDNVPQAYYVFCRNCGVEKKYRFEESAEAMKFVRDHKTLGHDAGWELRDDNNFI